MNDYSSYVFNYFVSKAEAASFEQDEKMLVDHE
jgi:hypothetical protein